MNIDTLISIGTQLASILIIMIIGLIAVGLLKGRSLKATRSSTKIQEQRKKQLETVIQAVGWIANVTIVVTALIMLLARFVNITPLLTGIGALGLALSLGAQTVIKDLIGGIIILIENQYTIGDVIEVGGVSGAVERLTLRATYLRGVDGILHLVPNGDVRTVSNITRDWSRATVDIGVAYEENLDRVLDVLKQEAAKFVDDAEFGPLLLEPPAVLGPVSLGDWALTVRIMVKTQPGKQWDVAVALRKRILQVCDEANITLPYPRQEVLLSNQQDSPSTEAA